MTDIERCDFELASISQDAKSGIYPAYLIALALNDWQTEKRIIQSLTEATAFGEDGSSARSGAANAAPGLNKSPVRSRTDV